MKLSYIKCPKDNGGCGNSDGWKVCIDRPSARIIVDCKCGYRHSLKFFVKNGNNDLVMPGPLDESGESCRN